MAAATEPQPEPPIDEQLRVVFLHMGFMETEATRLADARADPAQIGWWLEQGCSFKWAVEIAT